MVRYARRLGVAAVAALTMVLTVALAPVVGANAADDWSKGLTQAQINSSYGFAKWVSVNGDNEDQKADARRALYNLDFDMKNYPSYTKLGADRDATSLTNTRRALQEDINSNKFRTSLTNEPCRMDLPAGKGRRCNDPNRRLQAQQLNLQLLLGEQFKANAVSAINGHWGITDAQGIAWGEGYKIFYNGGSTGINEKANYEKDMTDGVLNGKASDGSAVGETGHYVNYVDDRYVYASIGVDGTDGFVQNYYLAPNTGGAISPVYSPGFGFPNDIVPEDSKSLTPQAMTLPENLLAKFNQYTALLDANTSYMVSFDSAGGTAVASQTVRKNSKASQPATPTRSGYSFAGWFNGSTKYDFNTPVTSNLKLTARWAQNTVYRTVSFDSAGGTAVASQKVADGSKASQPAPPTRSGYTFQGWYYGNAKWDFNTAVRSDLRLTAR
ncbi:InlB B-repeat-containing protein [Bifidobacterium simiarum]|uniref:SCP domain-containing protein n=1 Tax=Bifidobacterium simiarum TaxID=2045441 RepID=A0A2M9HDC3_9BIFI|nr:InlB B-repeat-containing protein [Bifidobacterium simiarum]PJM74801.1 hypothetical protein CSQ87_08750 [Bifidobacterium simiarum]